MAHISDVKSIEDMISFLKDKGRRHENYYHYTSWDSLTKIFQNKTFLLTRGNSLKINDQHEARMKGAFAEWNKIYIGSFAFGSSENIAMWGLYGLPWKDAVRICIPKDKMLRWLNSINQIKLFNDGESIEYQGGFDADLNDIVYVSGNRGTNNLILTHYGRSITVSQRYPLYGIDTADEMTGYIKNYAWQYENEVRLRIRLAHDTRSEKISVDIPDDVIDSITVTKGPNFVWKNDEIHQRLIAENRITDSSFENLINLKDICDMCQHHFTLKTQ